MTWFPPIWKTIPWARRYAVSSDGRVRSGDRILKPCLNDEGYPKIPLTDNNGRRSSHFVHRLVAELFLHRQPHQNYVLHRDGDRLNAKATNLRWGDHAENHQDKVLMNRHRNGCVRKLARREVSTIRRSTQSAKLLAEKYSISISHAREIKNGRKWGSV